jgi:hypothetical protein
MDVDVPKGTEGSVRVPVNGIASMVSVNGQVAWASNDALLYSSTYDDGYVTLHILHGAHNISVSDSPTAKSKPLQDTFNFKNQQQKVLDMIHRTWNRL